ncbi:MAG: hypothetical protein KJZ69_18040 [Phycisphaerales bacterium]|nr:hypothetical protein [Phycisphaerales bacterium]
MRSVRLHASWVGAYAALFAAHAIAQPTGVSGYDLIELRPVEWHLTTAVDALDDYARVLVTSGNAPSTPLVWINGERFIIPSPRGFGLVLAQDIGSAGVVVGIAFEDPGLLIRSFAWTVSDGIHLLDLLPGTSTDSVRAVDERPWPECLIGCDCGFTITYATLWRGTTPTQVGGPRSAIGAVNNLGHAVGASYNELYRVSRPTLWRDGQTIDIGGEPAWQDGAAISINDRDEVVARLTGFGVFHWYADQRTLLPDIGDCSSRGWAINNAGLIAGESNPDPRCRSGRQHAVAWERDGQQYTLFDLNEFITRHPGITLILAKDINDAGQIAAFGEYDDGRERGFLVTPYRFEMSDPVPGRAGTTNTITVTGLQPNQRVHLVWGTQEGAQKVRAACPGGTLLIRDPIALPAVRADVNGVATITVNVPLIARGRTVRLQAVAPVECEISHTITWTFE